MRIVCGLDVHKDSVFVCILNEKGEKFEAKYGVLTPELEELNQLRMKMLKNRFGQAGVSFLVAINRSKMQLRDLDNLPTSQSLLVLFLSSL